MNSNSTVIIKDGKDHRCPTCLSNVMVSNSTEAMYRKAILVHIDRKTGVHRFKCKQCKSWIEMTEDEIYK